VPAIGNIQRLRKGAGRVNTFLPALLACALPLSTSAVSGLGIIILFLWLVEGRFHQKMTEALSSQISIAVLGYLFFFVVGMLWTEHIGYGLETIVSQWKLLMLPVFLTIVRRDRRKWYIYCFLTGMTIIMLTTYLAWFDLLHYDGLSPEHLTRGTFHVVYNPLLAFSIYLIFHDVVWGDLGRGMKVCFVGLGCLMIVNMFITIGRTGQTVFFVLLILFLIQFFRGNLFRALLVAVIVTSGIFLSCYLVSPTFKGRVNAAYYEVTHIQKNCKTSVGMRVVVAENSWHIIRENWFFGVGTGDFPSVYARVNQERSPGVPAFDNPHNQYLFSWARFGLPGLITLLACFVVQIRQGIMTNDFFSRIRLALPVFFLTIMFSGSYLSTFETGFFFSTFSAILFKDC